MYTNNTQNLENKNIQNFTIFLRRDELHINERFGLWEKTPQLKVYREKPTLRENAHTRRGAKKTREKHRSIFETKFAICLVKKITKIF